MELIHLPIVVPVERRRKFVDCVFYHQAFRTRILNTSDFPVRPSATSPDTRQIFAGRKQKLTLRLSKIALPVLMVKQAGPVASTVAGWLQVPTSGKV